MRHKMNIILDQKSASQLDSLTIKNDYISGLALMEQAATKITEHIIRSFGDNKSLLMKSRFLFICGKGNNGGDCAAVARNLLYSGISNLDLVLVIKNNVASENDSKIIPEVISDINSLKDFLEGNVSNELLQMLLAYVKYGKKLYIVRNEADIETLKNLLAETDLIIDGMFGIGLKKEIQGIFSLVIDTVNDYVSSSTHTKVLSIDIPSGINTDNGKVLGSAIKADETVTFNFKKFGHQIYPGREYSGQVYIKNISFDERYLDSVEMIGHKALTINYSNIFENERAIFDYIKNNNDFCNYDKITEGTSDFNRLEHYFYLLKKSKFDLELKNIFSDLIKSGIIPQRSQNSNKGSYGKLLIIAGCDDMPGAAILASRSALRNGCGLVALMSSSECRKAVANSLPEAVLKNEDELDYKGYNSIIIGPGLSKSSNAKEKVFSLFDKASVSEGVRVVIDADAINILAEHMDKHNILDTDDRINYLNKKLTFDTILTPHKKELSRLLKIPMESLRNLNEIAQRIANISKNIFVLKDAATFVAGNGKIYINQSGNNGMSTAGSGDVLSGIIGSNLAQGYETFNAAVVGVFVHGVAGDIAKNKFGVRGLTAQNIADALSDAEIMM
jgi:NAD(P)H-hydrate epimerase